MSLSLLPIGRAKLRLLLSKAHKSPCSIFQLTAAYKADAFKNKVNLGVGAYRDDNNKPWILPVVQKVSVFRFPP